MKTLRCVSMVLAAALFTGNVALTVEPKEPAPKGFKIDGDPVVGKKLYATYCKKCHGEKGDGTGLMAKDLDPQPADFTDVAKMGKVSDWELFVGARDGGPAVGKSDKMTPNKDVLTEQEIHDVLAYVKTFWNQKP
jgi:cytochrome c oxidase cbb3-type subunit 3